jgi:protein involved in polysaccharide export with SLBB domain
MKTLAHTILTALLLLTAFPIFAEERNVERAKNQPKVVRVGGQVNRPGEIAYRDNTTILAMIIAAGGPTQFGKLNKVKVFRDGKNFELDLTNEKLKNKEFAVPEDYIEVPEKSILERLVPKGRG